jgi:hypothetical protein
VLFVNSLYFFIGLGVVILCIWFLTLDSTEDLDPQLYLTLAVLLLVTGILMFFLAMMGCVGAIFQTDRTGLFQGRRTLSIYQLLLFGVTIGQFYTSVYTYNAYVTLEEVEVLLKDGNNVVYDDFEVEYAEKFNAFYIDTLDTQTKHSWFWDWIDDNCLSSMGTAQCSYLDYSNECPDLDACALDTTSSECPYDLCRLASVSQDSRGALGKRGVVPRPMCPSPCERLRSRHAHPASLPRHVDSHASFPVISRDDSTLARAAQVDSLVSRLGPFASYSVFVSLFSVALMVLTCLLICYNPRDSQHEILVKSGAVEATAPLAGTPNTGSGRPKPTMV